MQTKKRNTRNKKGFSKKNKRGGILISSIKNKYDPMVKERNRLLDIVNELEEKLKKCNQVGGTDFLKRIGYTTSTEYNRVKSETIELQKQIENLEKEIKECQEHKENKLIRAENWERKMGEVIDKSNSSSMQIKPMPTQPTQPMFRPALIGGIIRKTMKKRKRRKNRK